MKRLLKMLLTLATTTTIPLTVVACGQANLDGTLNVIDKGETNWLINDLNIPGKTQNPNGITTFSLTTGIVNCETDLLAKHIAENILAKASLPNPIWYQNTLPVNKKCYNFTITNGTDNKGNKTWDVNQSTQRFTVKISYLVGTVANDDQHSFKASQKIDMSFDIKVGTSEHDKALAKWLNIFNQQPWKDKSSAIQVDLTSQKIALPSQVSWGDVDKKVIAATNDAITNALNWPGSKQVAWTVKGQGPIGSDNIIELKLDANYGDSKGTTNSFYVQFK